MQDVLCSTHTRHVAIWALRWAFVCADYVSGKHRPYGCTSDLLLMRGETERVRDVAIIGRGADWETPNQKCAAVLRQENRELAGLANTGDCSDGLGNRKWGGSAERQWDLLRCRMAEVEVDWLLGKEMASKGMVCATMMTSAFYI